MSTDRLDRMKALLVATIEELARTEQLVAQNAADLRETRAIADSNARSIEVWSSRPSERIKLFAFKGIQSLTGCGKHGSKAPEPRLTYPPCANR